MIKILFISIVIFIVDLASKILVQNTLILYRSVAIIDDFFYLTYTHNYGAAFSIFENSRFLLIFVALLVLVLLLFYLKKNLSKRNIEIVSYGILIGGIIGNLYDRIIYGYVIDFFDFYIFGYDFAVFNFADCAIVIAILILIFDCLFGGVRSEDNNS